MYVPIHHKVRIIMHNTLFKSFVRVGCLIFRSASAYFEFESFSKRISTLSLRLSETFHFLGKLFTSSQHENRRTIVGTV